MSAPAPTPTSAPNGVELVRIGAAQDGQRIDNFLITRIKGVPRSHLYRILRRGEVRVNKGRIRPSYRLQSGDLVRIPPTNRTRSHPAPPVPARLKHLLSAVLHEDKHLMAIDKPSGIAVHGGSGLSWGLIEAMRNLRPELPGLELVHRLDRETSGCLLLSKHRGTLRELHRLMREQAMEKRYLTLLAGDLKRRELRVDAPLRKNLLRSGERIVRIDHQTGKPACTRFRALRRFGAFTLVEARPLSGRTHQIRVHAAHLGAPVAGDEKYGSTRVNRRLRDMGLSRLFLHASALIFQPGYSDRTLRIEAPLPPELQTVVEALRNL